ncbi:MAG: hypothetical protein FWH43_06160 [Endomicrobia bacterium]|nr:hypothetical protein [Endomicrobiia bacterium]
MFLRKAPSFRTFFGKGFLFNKKLMALFIFISLSVNGYAPSAAEVSKYSFVMAVITVTQKVAVQIIEKCDLSIADLSSSICQGFFRILDKTPINQKGHENEQGEENSPIGNVEGIIIKQAIFNEKVKVSKESVVFLNLANGISFEKTGINFTNAGNAFLYGIVLLFLIFIAAILQRKKLNEIENKINIYRKAIPV